MKRSLSVFVVVALTLVFAGPAAPDDFDAGHLIQVVYNDTDSELGVDLTSLAGGSIDWESSDVQLAPPGTVNLDDFIAISAWADLNVGFFVADDTTFDAYFATTQPTPPGVTSAYLNFINGYSPAGFRVTYQTASTPLRPGVVNAPIAAPTTPGYDIKYNVNSNAPGAYANYNADPDNGEANLAPLDTGGSVYMYLYNYTFGTLVPGASADYTAVLRVDADGSTWLNPVVPTPPTIVTDPLAQTVSEGETATFTVVATGTEPLSYQWRKDGGDISGATSDSYSLTAILADDGSTFDCVVTNAVDTVTSAAALLTVNAAPPSIVTDPVDQTVTEGETATFTVVGTGTEPLSYQWQEDGGDIVGATDASYTTPPTTFADHGVEFRCVVTNVAGSATSDPATLTVNSPPSIVTDPVAQTVSEGETATFAVVGTGTEPLSYQWRKNSAPIGGATSASYSLTATLADDGALFDCVVTNAFGSATSATALLTVSAAPLPPTIVTDPESQTVLEGETATFIVEASGSQPLSYQWRRDGGDIIGATSDSYSLTATLADNGSTFDCVVTNAFGSATSAAALLTVNAAPPTIVNQPVDKTVTEGDTPTFAVTATGTAPLSYQWRKDGVAIGGATSASYTLPATTPADNGAGFRCVVTNVAGSVTSAVATLTVNIPPSVTTQPVDQTVTEGDTPTFAVTATGTAPLSYQWRKNGVAIGGATSASYITPGTTLADDGSQFDCVVTNVTGTVTTNTALLTVTARLPTIVTHPTDQGVFVGDTATFTVVATGTAPLSYQWQKDSTDIPGATSASYITPATTLADNGSQFHCVVTNVAGSVTSNSALLTVSAAPVAPTITDQPDDQTVLEGDTATFSVTASGTEPLSYQWRRDDTDIPGATSASYTTSPTTPDDDGTLFDCVVTNSVGSATSAVATLTVNSPPSIKTQPVGETVTHGQTATFTVAAEGTTPLSYQWRKDGADIVGATSTSYTTPLTTLDDDGTLFDCVVENVADSETSDAAELMVTPPALKSPEDGETEVALTPTLETEPFAGSSDHTQTRWQISTSLNAGELDEGALVLDLTSPDDNSPPTSYLTSLPLGDGLLEGEKTYYWRVKFEGSNGTASPWTETWSFTTKAAEWDGGPVDTLVGEAQMSVNPDTNVDAVLFVKAVDPETVSDPEKPELPLGLLSFKVELADPNNPIAKVKVVINESVSGWYVHDMINGGRDVSDSGHVTFAEANGETTVTLTVKDGAGPDDPEGLQDGDGIQNGFYVDPAGPTGLDAGGTGSLGLRLGSGSDDSCFIASAFHDPVPAALAKVRPVLKWAWVLLMGTGITGWMLLRGRRALGHKR